MATISALSTTAPQHAAPAVAVPARRTWIAPAVAAGVGTVAALATAWWVAGLELSMSVVGF